MRKYFAIAFLIVGSLLPRLAVAQSMLLLGAGSVKNGTTLSGWCSKIPQSGLVNCLPFDTTYTTTSKATDPIGGLNATLTAVTLNGSGPSTNLNNAGVFNGTTSKGDTSVSPATSPPYAAFTVVFWVNPNAAIANSSRFIANDFTSGDHKGFEVYYDLTNKAVIFVAGNGTTSISPSTGASSVPLSAWTMVAETYDGTTAQTYHGSTAGGSGSLAGPLATPTNALGIGYIDTNSTAFANCMIAGIAIYNRALSSAEITSIAGL